MGQDKNFLRVEGQALLSRVCRACVQLGPTWVVARQGQKLPELHGALRVADELFGSLGGPLVGIASGLGVLAASGIERAMICAGDDVGLSIEGLRTRALALMDLEGEKAEVVGVCLVAQGRRQPLACAVRVPPALARARELLARGEVRARTWAEDFLLLEGAAFGEVYDLDTPAELEAFTKSRSEDS